MAVGENRLDAAQSSRQETRSLHQRILTDIRDKILSGAWPPGHRVPFEHELTEQYQCSRMTVNKALTELVNAGLIERHRRSGSFVRRPASQTAALEINDIENEVKALDLVYHYDMTDRRLRDAGPEDQAALGLSEGIPLLQITCMHHAGPRPFCFEERVINCDAVPEAKDTDFSKLAPGSWLLRKVPWSVAENHIRAVGASQGVAQALDVSKGTPCLVIERRTWIGGQPITRVRLTYAGETHMLVARFSPAQK
jgi:GntR family histidine utilization transcriptional repressor